jgi:hypothetical protein
VNDKTVARGIGLTTAASGVWLLVAPSTSLRAMGASTARPAPLLYRVVGMFMTVCGGLLTDGTTTPVVVRWALAQKTGAVGGVVLGVVQGDYRKAALGVAAFDAVSAVLLARMLRRSP